MGNWDGLQTSVQSRKAEREPDNALERTLGLTPGGALGALG